MVPAAVQFVLFVKVDEVDQEFGALGTAEASRMPAFVRSGSGGRDADVARVNDTGTLKKKKIRNLS